MKRIGITTETFMSFKKAKGFFFFGRLKKQNKTN